MGIRYEIYIFLFSFCKFSILFNGMFSFCHFPMLFNGNLRIEKLGGGRTDGRTYVRTDVRKFTPVSYRTSALWGRCPKRERRKRTRKWRRLSGKKKWRCEKRRKRRR